MIYLVAGVIGVVIGAYAFRRVFGRLVEARSESILDSMLDRWRLEHAVDTAETVKGRSYGVLKGQITEQVVPLFAEFPYSPGDARFLGKPIDFLVFDGYREVVAGRADRLREIVFVEVKTGRAGLNAVERRIRECVEAGRVRCVVLEGSGDSRARPDPW
jgi:predicted Holliday junction resolvase-like endonuclease